MGCSVILAGCSSTGKERFDACATYVKDGKEGLNSFIVVFALYGWANLTGRVVSL